MDFGEILVSVVVVLLFVVGLFAVMNDFNKGYGVDMGAELADSRQKVDNITSNTLINIGEETAANLEDEDGSSPPDAEQGIIQRSVSTFNLIKDLSALVPVLIQEGGAAIGIPSVFTRMAMYLFVTLFALAFAFLLFTGARSRGWF